MKFLKILFTTLYILLGITIGIVALVLIYINTYVSQLSQTPALPAAFPEYPQWKHYSDPEGYFTIVIPSDWEIAQQDGGRTTVSDKNGTFSWESTYTTFNEPNSSKHVTISVDKYGRFEQEEVCLLNYENNASNPNTTLAHLPARYDNWTGWSLTTVNAGYQIATQAQSYSSALTLPTLYDENTPPKEEPKVDPIQQLSAFSALLFGTYDLTERKIISTFRPAVLEPRCKTYRNL